MFDFSKYFDNIDHEKLKVIIDGSYTDKRLAGFIKRLVDDFGGDKGLGLGSQISQVSALRFASRLDHYVKEVLRIKGYGRYMDDGYMLHPDKAYLQKCLADLRTICDCLGIKPNEKKTQIVKLSRGIPFLKHRFILTETGKVVILPARQNIVRERRKLKKFKKRFDEGNMAMQSLLRNNIIDAHDRYTKKKYCPIYAKESVTKTYEAYHALGGNGVVTKLYNDIMALPEDPPVTRKKKSSGGAEL